MGQDARQALSLSHVTILDFCVHICKLLYSCVLGAYMFVSLTEDKPFQRQTHPTSSVFCILNSS